MKSTFKPKSFYIYVRHCPRRSLDATKLSKYFVENGLQPVDSPNIADLIVIYTCGAFSNNEERSILTIENSLRTNARVIITGCLPKIDPARIATYKKAQVIPVEDLGRLDSLINAKVPYSHSPNPSIVYGVNDLLKGGFIRRLKSNFEFSHNFLKVSGTFLKKKVSHKSNNSGLVQKYYKLEIARGCLGSCSYCAIRKAMEKFHSFPEEQIIDNFRAGLKEGYTDFAIIAGDIGCYGLDMNTNLPHLLKKLFATEGKYKFLLVDLNPRWLKAYISDLFSVLKINAEKVSRIIIPIQSGSDRILELMNRNYKIDEVKKCLLDLHKNFPEVELETHIIVGFPGETYEDFQKSKELVRELEFASVNIYRYEDRPGTAASKLPCKLNKNTISKWARTLAKETITHNEQFGVDGLRI